MFTFTPLEGMSESRKSGPPFFVIETLMDTLHPGKRTILSDSFLLKLDDALLHRFPGGTQERNCTLPRTHQCPPPGRTTGYYIKSTTPYTDERADKKSMSYSPMPGGPRYGGKTMFTEI